MFRFPAKCFLFILFVFSGNLLLAQTSSTSNPNSERENIPYSKFGIGELWNGNTTSMKAMSNITSAYQDPYLINSDNPASYSALMLTTVEGGIVASHSSLVSNLGGGSYQTGTSSLGYINIGMPVSKHFGFSFGLKPVSRAYYALVDTLNAPISPIGQAIRSYGGQGGLNYGFAGLAYRYKELSVGVNFGYMFGNYTNLTSVIPIDTAAVNRAYESQYSRYTRVGGLYWKGGLIYEHKMADSEYIFRIGGTITLSQSLNEKMSNYQVSIYNLGDTLVNDTSLSSVDLKGKLKLPMSYSVGVMLTRLDKWSFGLDYTATKWSEYNSTPDSNMNLNIGSMSYKFAIGGEYTPNVNDIHTYFSRVTFRFGVHYGVDYLRIDNTNLPDFGVSLGGSFPYRRSARTHSRLNASFDIGRLGTTANNLVQQTYFRFGLGLSFNDKWFIPRKYD